MTSTKENEKAVARGAGLLLPSRILGSALSLGFDVLLNGLLGIELYGLSLTVRRVLGYLFLLVLLGTENAVVKWVSEGAARGDAGAIRGTVRGVGGVTLAWGLFLAAVLFVFADPLAAWIDPHPDLPRALRLVSVLVPLSAVRMVAVSASQGLKSLGPRALVMDLLWPGIAILLSLLFCRQFGWGIDGVWWALDGSMVIGVVLALAMLWYRRRDIFLEGHVALGPIRSFATPLWLYTLANGVYAWADQVMLAALGGLTLAGAYGPVANLAPLFPLGLTALNGLFAPVIAELHLLGKRDDLRSLYQSVTRWATALAMPPVAVAVAAPQLVLAIWPSADLSACSALRATALLQLVGVMVGSVNYLLMMSGRPKQVLWNAIPAMLANIALSWILIPHLGVLGAALANGLSLCVASLGGLAQVRWILGMHPIHRGLLKPLIAGAFATGVCALLAGHMPSAPPLVVVALLGTATTVAFFLGHAAVGFEAGDVLLVRRLRRR